MISLRFNELANLIDGHLITPQAGERCFTGVSIDSRTIGTDELFVAIKGVTLDGHDFIEQAIDGGAAGLLVTESFNVADEIRERVSVVSVPDSHQGMVQLAKVYRDRIPAKRVGITGTNGKTTTKELTHRLLSALTSEVYQSPGNYNNLFGMPLALLRMPQETRYAVLEMGISQPGEMKKLADIVRPDVMVFTNVGPSHLEFLGSIQGVAEEKSSMIEVAPPNAPVIVNFDDSILMQTISRHHMQPYSFGLTPSSQLHPDSVTTNSDGHSVVTIRGKEFILPLFGHHQVYNLLAAFAVCDVLGFSFDDIDTKHISLTTAPMRGESIQIGEITLIVDCYNANPASVKSGLESFGQMLVGGRRVVILGDMLELGNDENRWHVRVGDQLDAKLFDLVVLVGKRSKATYDSAINVGFPPNRVHWFEDASSCAEEIQGLLGAGDVVYLKASRGVGLEKVAEQLKQEEMV